jgi:hypothetical protein
MFCSVGMNRKLSSSFYEKMEQLFESHDREKM